MLHVSIDTFSEVRIMKGLKVTVEKGELVVRIPLMEPRKSKSGNTMVVASTGGNQKTDCEYKGHEITLGLNAYYKD